MERARSVIVIRPRFTMLTDSWRAVGAAGLMGTAGAGAAGAAGDRVAGAGTTDSLTRRAGVREGASAFGAAGLRADSTMFSKASRVFASLSFAALAAYRAGSLASVSL